MNKVLMFLLFTAFVLTAPGFAQTPAPAEAPAAPAAPAPMAHHGHHPELTKAIHDLHLAKNHLEDAAHDYGGHRVKAIAAIDQALEELHEALSFDK